MTWLVLDTSASMTFGTADRRKADVAEGVALAVGHVATRRGNRLGVVDLRRRAAAALPPRAGPRRPARRCCSRCARSRCSSGGGATSLGDGARAGRRGSRSQRSLVVVVSDFRGPRDWRPPLLAARRRPRRARGRDPRPARAGAPERRRALARRSRDRPPAPRRHAQREAARALRGRGGRGARRGRAGARRRSASATSCSRPRATGCGRSRVPPAARRRRDELRVAARAAGAARRAARDRSATSCSSGAGAGSAARVRDPGAAAEPRRPQPRPAPPPRRPRSLLVRAGGPGRSASHARTRRSPSAEQATVVLAMDISARWPRPTCRRAGSRPRSRRSSRFLDKLPEKYRVGMVSFAQSAQTRPARDGDRDAAQAALRNLRTGDGTALGEGIARAIQVAQRVPRRGGEEAAGVDPGPLRRRPDAGRARAAGGRDAGEEAEDPCLHGRVRNRPGVVEVVDDNGFTQRVTVPPDPPTLRKVAQATGGRFYAAPDAAQLNAVYEELGSRIGSVKKEREITARLRRGRRVPAARRRRGLRVPLREAAVKRALLVLAVAAARRAASARPPRARERVRGAGRLHPGQGPVGAGAAAAARRPTTSSPAPAAVRSSAASTPTAPARSSSRSSARSAARRPRRDDESLRAVFVARTTRSLASFRPLLGCIPASGGGGRARTSYEPKRKLTAPRRAGGRRDDPPRQEHPPEGHSERAATYACLSGERLLAYSRPSPSASNRRSR